MTCSNGKNFVNEHNALPLDFLLPLRKQDDPLSTTSYLRFLLFIYLLLFFRHFTIRGAEETDFAGGIYHGRILLPPEFPFKPPHIMFLTPSGRFETNTKVCLSFSAYHPELWQPAWVCIYLFLLLMCPL
jgi:hypothetical protein